MAGFTIRPAVIEDCDEIVRLIKELAVYEKLEEQVKITAEVLRRDGFGDEKYFHCLVVEDTECNEVTANDTKSGLLGYALYFYTYSTWDGRVMYLEDLYVAQAYRGRGIGTKLFKTVAEIAVEKDCQRMQWVVVNWNTPSIEFYKARGACDLTATEKWHIFRMNKPEVEKLATS